MDKQFYENIEKEEFNSTQEGQGRPYRSRHIYLVGTIYVERKGNRC